MGFVGFFFFLGLFNGGTIGVLEVSLLFLWCVCGLKGGNLY